MSLYVFGWSGLLVSCQQLQDWVPKKEYRETETEKKNIAVREKQKDQSLIELLTFLILLHYEYILSILHTKVPLSLWPSLNPPPLSSQSFLSVTTTLYSLCAPSVSHQANKDEAKLDDISVRNRIEAPQKRVDDRDSCRDNDGKVGRQPKNNAHRSPWKTHRTLNQRGYLKIWWELYDLTL